jgi:hypothetical protein
MSTPNPEKPEPPRKKETFMEAVLHHKWDSVAYIILLIGLLLSVYRPFVGGVIVGTILGLYFAKQLQQQYESFVEHVVNEGIFSGLVMIATLLAIFIASPGLVIGGVFGTFLRLYLGAGSSLFK